MNRDYVNTLNHLYESKIVSEDIQMPTGEQNSPPCNSLPEDCEACEGVYGDHVEHTEDSHITRQALFKLNKMSGMLFNRVSDRPVQKEDKYKLLLALDYIKEILHKYNQ